MVSTIDLHHKNFDQFLDSDQVVVVYFRADWCQPCKVFRPIFDATAAERDDACFGIVDTEQQSELVKDFEIRSVPTVMIFREHVALCMESGTLTASSFNDLIDQAKNIDMDEVHKNIAKTLME